MNAADPRKSARLRRVHALLADGSEHSTRNVASRADVCAVNSCVAELRAHGAWIELRWERRSCGGRVALYRMIKPVPGLEPAAEA